MVGTPVKIGPFNGGLNSYSGPTSIGDNECSDISNFDIDLDGSLYSRSPIVKLAGIGVTGDIKMLGWFIDTDGTRYLVFSCYNSTNVGTLIRNEETGAISTITGTCIASCVVQYGGKLWLIPDPSQTQYGGWWTPASGYTAVPAIPKGTSVCVYKERLFIGGSTSNPNRVYFSNPADPTTWQTSINFFDARSGDGQDVIKVMTYQDTVVIFKTASTYVYSYDSNPSRGSVRVVNSSVGITNKECVVEYEGSLYLVDEDRAYQVSNWNFTLINLKVPFVVNILFPSITANGTAISIMSDRLVIHYYDNIYVFNLRMGVWTKWDVDINHLFNYFIEVPKKVPSEPEKYYGGTRIATNTTNHNIFEWRPVPEAARAETMSCYVTTKAYDFNVPHTFKRLFWWGVDLLSYKDLTYLVHPVAYAPATTHQQLSAYKHNQILGTYLRPLNISIDYSGSKNISNSIGYRMFVKLLKGTRFRQISFTVGGNTDGSTTTGPIRIFGITAFVDNKQLVSKDVS